MHGAVRRRVVLSRVVVAGGSGASAWAGFCAPRPPVREPRSSMCGSPSPIPCCVATWPHSAATRSRRSAAPGSDEDGHASNARSCLQSVLLPSCCDAVALPVLRCYVSVRRRALPPLVLSRPARGHSGVAQNGFRLCRPRRARRAAARHHRSIWPPAYSSLLRTPANPRRPRLAARRRSLLPPRAVHLARGRQESHGLCLSSRRPGASSRVAPAW